MFRAIAAAPANTNPRPAETLLPPPAAKTGQPVVLSCLVVWPCPLWLLPNLHNRGANPLPTPSARSLLSHVALESSGHSVFCWAILVRAALAPPAAQSSSNCCRHPCRGPWCAKVFLEGRPLLRVRTECRESKQVTPSPPIRFCFSTFKLLFPPLNHSCAPPSAPSRPWASLPPSADNIKDPSNRFPLVLCLVLGRKRGRECDFWKVCHCYRDCSSASSCFTSYLPAVALPASNLLTDRHLPPTTHLECRVCVQSFVDFSAPWHRRAYLTCRLSVAVLLRRRRLFSLRTYRLPPPHSCS